MQNSLHFSMKWLVCLWSISYVYAKEDTEEIKYHYRENIEVIHEDTALLDLFTLPLASNSSFIFNVYTSISGARRVDVQRRNLTYILACTPTAYDTIQAGRDEYCKNGLYTSDICTLYPLPATGSSSTFYASEQLIEGNAPFFEGGGKQDIHFMLTNCEIYGGDSNILRSCLKPLLSEDCHYCPNVEMEEDERKYRKENCRIPPLMHGAITFRASYTYCTFSDSDCLPVHQKQIPTVLGCLMGIWCIGLFLWIRNIHTHSHIATTSIQKIMTLLPIFYVRKKTSGKKNPKPETPFFLDYLPHLSLYFMESRFEQYVIRHIPTSAVYARYRFGCNPCNDKHCLDSTSDGLRCHSKLSSTLRRTTYYMRNMCFLYDMEETRWRD